MEPNRYVDPLEEALSHGSQRVAQFASLAAAMSQVVIQRRALHDALAAGHDDDRTASALRRQQRALHEQARLTWAPANDPQWLAQADLLQAGRAWAAAASFADGDPAASLALRRCEDRLRTLHPYAMARYDRLRIDGRTPCDAMLEAAPLFARSPHVRTGQAAATRAALDGEAPNDGKAEPAPGPDSTEAAPVPDADEQAERRGQQIADRLQAQARATGRPALGADELAMVLETITNLPESTIAKITGQVQLSGPLGSTSAAQVAAKCFPVTAADAVTAFSTGRTKIVGNGGTLRPAANATKRGRSAP